VVPETFSDNEPPYASWDTAATFDAIYQVAKVKGIEAEF
jgi:hypothetical protein